MKLVNGLHFNNIRGDIYGGLTASVVALPLALAMGVTSGAGPIAGLYGAICVGFFAALFGGTPAQVSGPTGPMTVVMALIFTQYTAMFPEDPASGATIAFTVVMLGGVFQIGFGFLRIGKFIELVPHPVVSGFMSGIGVIIILLQIGPMLGFSSPAKPLEAVLVAPEFFAQPLPAAVILGVISLAIVYGIPAFLPALNRLIPSPLFALIAGTTVYVLLMQETGTPVLGDIPSGLPKLQFPVFYLDLLPQMIGSGITLAALGSIDSLLTSLVADNITRTYHKSDRELIGQGIGNTIAGLFGGLPGAGATMRTVVNVKAGGQTPVSGALHAVILLVIVLGAGGLAASIPKAVLAGILVKVGTDIIDWDYFKRLKTAPKAGVAMMLTVLLLTVFVDLIMAVAVGMVMASMVFLKRMADLQLDGITLTNKSGEEQILDKKEAAILDAAQGRILLYHMQGPLSFGAAKGMVRRLANFREFDVLLLDMADVSSIDFTSSRAIEDMICDALSAKREVYLAGLRPEVMQFLQQQEIIQKIDASHLHARRIDALCMAADKLEINPDIYQTE